MTRIAAVVGRVPDHRYSQTEISREFARVLSPDRDRLALLERFHSATGITARNFALPLEAYAGLDGFTGANDAFIAVGTDLAEKALGDALTACSLQPSDVDLVMSTTVTGVAAPSIEARLVDRLGLRDDVKRVPIFGLGCVAGAAGIARLHDYLVGHPNDVAVLLSVELCSLTVQRDDVSTANLVASGLFGDGAAAVVMVGDERAAAMNLDDSALQTPRVVTSRSRFYPGTDRVMGWDIGSTGFRIVLSADVAQVVETHLRADVTAFLARQGLTLDDITTWVAHPGGPKVMDAVELALGLDDKALVIARESLARDGNLSSASVLHVLEQTMRERPGEPGQRALVFALGPGFCAELVLLEW